MPIDPEYEDLPFGSIEKEPLIFFTGNVSFLEAGQLIAASPEQWEKLTKPNLRHFCGNWTAKTLLEIAFRYLCHSNEWLKFRNVFEEIPSAAYDELRGNIAIIAQLGTHLLEDYFRQQCNKGGCGHFYFEQLPAAAQKCFGNEDAAVLEAFNEATSSGYYTITEDNLAVLMSEVQRAKINATWLNALLAFVDDTTLSPELFNTNRLLIITSNAAYNDRLDYVINTITTLTDEEISLIFPHWQEAEIKHHIQVYGALSGSLQQALYLSSEWNSHHIFRLINCLLDWFRHHLKNEKPQIRRLTYINLRNILGITLHEVILPDNTQAMRTTHEATLKQCIDPDKSSEVIEIY